MTKDELDSFFRRNPGLKEKIQKSNERQLRELDAKFLKQKEESEARRGVSKREKEVKNNKPPEGASDSDKSGRKVRG